MEKTIQDTLNQIFQILKNNSIELTSAYKEEVARYISRKLERAKLYYELKEHIPQDIFDERIKEEKIFDEMFKNIIIIAAKAKAQATINEISDVFSKAFDKILSGIL